MFVNTIPIRSYPSGNITIADFVESVRDSILKAFENQNYSLEELIDRLNIPRDLSRNPLIDTIINRSIN